MNAAVANRRQTRVAGRRWIGGVERRRRLKGGRDGSRESGGSKEGERACSSGVVEVGPGISELDMIGRDVPIGRPVLETAVFHLHFRTKTKDKGCDNPKCGGAPETIFVVKPSFKFTARLPAVLRFDLGINGLRSLHSMHWILSCSVTLRPCKPVLTYNRNPNLRRPRSLETSPTHKASSVKRILVVSFPS